MVCNGTAPEADLEAGVIVCPTHTMAQICTAIDRISGSAEQDVGEGTAVAPCARGEGPGGAEHLRLALDLVHEANHLRMYHRTPLGWCLDHFRAVQLNAFFEATQAAHAPPALPLLATALDTEHPATPDHLRAAHGIWAQTTGRMLAPRNRERRVRDLASTAQTNHELLYASRSRTKVGEWGWQIVPVWPRRRRGDAVARVFERALEAGESGIAPRTPCPWPLRSTLMRQQMQHAEAEARAYYVDGFFCPVVGPTGGPPQGGCGNPLSGAAVMEACAVLQELFAAQVLGLPPEVPLSRTRPTIYHTVMALFYHLFPDTPPVGEVLAAWEGPSSRISNFEYRFGPLLAALKIACCVPYHPLWELPNDGTHLWFDMHPGWRCLRVLQVLSRNRDLAFSDRTLVADQLVRLGHCFGWPSYMCLCAAWNDPVLDSQCPARLPSRSPSALTRAADHGISPDGMRNAAAAMEAQAMDTMADGCVRGFQPLLASGATGTLLADVGGLLCADGYYPLRGAQATSYWRLAEATFLRTCVLGIAAPNLWQGRRETCEQYVRELFRDYPTATQEAMLLAVAGSVTAEAAR